MPGRLLFSAVSPTPDGWLPQPYDLLPPGRRAAEVAQALLRGESLSTVDEDMVLVVSELRRRGHPVELHALDTRGNVTRIRLDADGHLLDVLPNRVPRHAVVEMLLGGGNPTQVADLLGLDE